MDMKNRSDIYTIYENGWINRIRPARTLSKPEKVLLLLHGWTGDEHSMWVFTSKLPDDYWLIALRGPIKTPTSGYAWVNQTPGVWPKLSQFKSQVDAVFNHLNHLNKYLDISPNELGVIGFSQGGAMAYSCALLYPHLVQKTAVMSGFMPTVDLPELKSEVLQKNKFLITHGKLDEIVPIEKAREAVSYLRKLGVSPEYCEEEIGHKLSAACYKTIQQFFA